jgi:hypothetical protein
MIINIEEDLDDDVLLSAIVALMDDYDDGMLTQHLYLLDRLSSG